MIAVCATLEKILMGWIERAVEAYIKESSSNFQEDHAKTKSTEQILKWLEGLTGSPRGDQIL